MMSLLCLFAAVLSLLSVTLAGEHVQMNCDDSSAIAGGNATLNCSVRLSHIVCVYKTFTCNVPDLHGRFKDISHEGNSTHLKLSLLIMNIEEKDQKQYDCYVQATCGTGKASATLTIMEPDHIHKPDPPTESEAFLKVLLLPFLMLVVVIIVFVAMNRKRLQKCSSCAGHADQDTVSYTAGTQVQEPV